MGLLHEKLKQKIAGSRGGFGWKPKDGDNRIFVLPPASEFVTNLDGMENIAYQYKAHYFRIEGRQGEASRCLQDIGARCPACAVNQHFSNSKDPGLQELGKEVKATEVYVLNIIDLNDQSKGVQRWGANWTCHSKIIEIVANLEWGYVLDPANGVPFVVSKVPKGQSRTGWPQYSVMPQPNRLNVMPILQAGEKGLAVLDGIEEAVMAAKTAEEITTLLDEMGFPGMSTGARPPTVIAHGSSAVPGAVAAVAAVAAQPVMAAPSAQAVPVAVVIPTMTLGSTAASPLVHYDPGAMYVEKVPATQRPAGVPRCWGDYNPTLHRCQPCPVQSDCKMKFMGIV